MAEDSIGIQEFVESYIPEMVMKRLEEKPVEGMEGTEFTLQLTIRGEKTLTHGITIKDAKKITVTPGRIENPMLEVVLPDDFIRPLVDMVTSFTGRKQYDVVSKAKGSVHIKMSMPGNWELPVTATFNGAAKPEVSIAATSADFAAMATGELNPPTAFMQGKVKLEGDMAFALSLANLMP